MSATYRDGVVVSIATLIDLWYVTQTTQKLTDAGRHPPLQTKLRAVTGAETDPEADVSAVRKSFPGPGAGGHLHDGPRTDGLSLIQDGL